SASVFFGRRPSASGVGGLSPAYPLATTEGEPFITGERDPFGTNQTNAFNPVADFNADGIGDFATFGAESSDSENLIGTVAYFGSPIGPRPSPVGVIISDQHVFADINGDGRSEIITMGVGLGDKEFLLQYAAPSVAGFGYTMPLAKD